MRSRLGASTALMAIAALSASHADFDPVPAPMPERKPSGTDRKKAKMGRKQRRKLRAKKRRAKLVK